MLKSTKTLAPRAPNEIRDVFKEQNKCVTLVAATSAAGEMVLSAKIYSNPRIELVEPQSGSYLPRELRPSRKTWPRFYVSNTTGYMNKELWVSLVELLVTEVRKGGREVPLLILADRASVHDVPELLSSLLAQNVHILYFPHNTSHILQPLDGAPFAVYKRTCRRLMASKAINTATHLGSPIGSVNVVEAAEELTFMSNAIRAGFSSRGIFPYDRSLVMKNVEAALPPLVSEPSDRLPVLAEEANAVLHSLVSDYTPQKDLARIKVILDRAFMTSEEIIELAKQKEEEKKQKQALNKRGRAKSLPKETNEVRQSDEIDQGPRKRARISQQSPQLPHPPPSNTLPSRPAQTPLCIIPPSMPVHPYASIGAYVPSLWQRIITP